MYQNIVVALDGSEFAERVLPYVEELAAKFGSSLQLVYATTAGSVIIAETAGMPADAGAIVDPTPIIEAQQGEAEAYLSGVAKRLSAKGLNVSYSHPEGQAAEVICALAKDSGADLIAMTTHGRRGVARAILGSTAENVLHKAICPVLVVRVHDEPQAAKR
jgi:nucleotide-binding universal stress UspA family protein